MTEPQIFHLLNEVEVLHPRCGETCPSPEELQALAAGEGPADESLLEKVAACGACSAALKMLLDLAEQMPEQTPAETRSEKSVGSPGHPETLSLESHRRRKRIVKAIAAAAAVLLISAVISILSRTGSEPAAGTTTFKVQHSSVVFLIEGRSSQGDRALSPGDALHPGDVFTLGPGTRIALLDRENGSVTLIPGEGESMNNPIMAQLATDLGPGRQARLDRVAEIPSQARPVRPDFLALEPREGIRSDRPTFKFHVATIGPQEDLILRVLDEKGFVLEHRFQGIRTVKFPDDHPPLERGKKYVWQVFHPRSGPGPLGGEPFTVISAGTLNITEQTEAALARLGRTYPRWAVSLFRALLFHRYGLQREALDALPEKVPGKVLTDFLLGEKALILYELGYDDQIGPIKEKLGLPVR